MKKTIQIDGYSTNEFSGYHKISDIEEYLKEMKTKGYTHIDIIYDAVYEEVCFTPYRERLETDTEYEQRMSRDKYFDETVRLNELKELERLKEKYG
jgi:delta-aminolevulinic acid dehydratase/porphobilinogen synthase